MYLLMRIAKACAVGLVACYMLWPCSAGTAPLSAPLPPSKPDLASIEVSYKDLDMTRPSSVRDSNPSRSSQTAKTAADTPWQSGLNAWRSMDYQRAHETFAEIAKGNGNYSLSQRSAAAFWAARAADRLGKRRVTQGYLKLSAQASQTFYGQVSGHILKKNAPLALTKLPMLKASTDSSVQGNRALVYAIILQESRFNAKAKSSQGARGLMQLMPATARHIDKSYKGEEQLFNEAYNVRLGSSYLKMLSEQPDINNEPFLVLAAYNNGPYALSKWLAKAPMDVKSDPFLLMETYPVAQTRNYIEKVMANMWAYERMLGKKSGGETLGNLAKAF